MRYSKNHVTVFTVICLMMTSCAFEPLIQKQKAASSTQTQTGGFDRGRYFDASRGMGRSATTDTVQNYVNGTYINGNSSIYFSGEKLVFMTPSMTAKGFEGKSCRIEYEYQILPAGDKAVYLCPKNPEKFNVKINGEYIQHSDVPDTLLLIPMWGFGENRIEISSAAAGYSGLPAGAYWKN